MKTEKSSSSQAENVSVLLKVKINMLHSYNYRNKHDPAVGWRGKKKKSDVSEMENSC